MPGRLAPFVGARAVRPRRPEFSRRAFTLIEVLLAVVVFGVVLVAMHGVFYGALRLRNKTVASLEAAVPLQQTLAIIQRDLANLVLPGGTLAGQLQGIPTQQTELGQIGPFLYTAVGILSASTPWAPVQRVAYRLTQPTNDSLGLDLYRSVSRNLLPVTTDLAEDQYLMSGIETILFEYYDGTQWRDYWDSTAETTAGLPAAIKLRLFLAGAQTNRFLEEPVELVVPVVVQSATNQTTQTSQTTGTTGGGA
jgi:type II secretion system protein J